MITKDGKSGVEGKASGKTKPESSPKGPQPADLSTENPGDGKGKISGRAASTDARIGQSAEKGKASKSGPPGQSKATTDWYGGKKANVSSSSRIARMAFILSMMAVLIFLIKKTG